MTQPPAAAPARRRAARRGAAGRATAARPAAAADLPAALRPAAARLRLSGLELPDAKLHAAARRVERIFDLAVEKVVAHEEAPERFRLPASSASLERRLLDVVRELPRRARRELVRQVMPRVEQSASARRRRLGDLAAIDLASPAPILDRVRALPVPRSIRLTRAEAARAERALAGQVAPRRAPRGAVEFNRLRARVVSVECLRTTAELNRDEIAVDAVAIDNLGNVTEVGPIALGRFGRGDLVTFAPPDRRQVFEFDVTAGDGFPRAFAVTYLLREEDRKLARVVRGALFAIGLVLQAGAFIAAAAATPPAAAVLIGATALGGLLEQPAWFTVFVGGEVVPHETAVLIRSLTEGLSDQDDAASSLPETVTTATAQGGLYRLTTDYRLVTV